MSDVVVSPALAVRLLRAQGLEGIILLESLGPVVDYGRYCFLSAVPTQRRYTLPPRPTTDAFFPAWLGGLKYEAAHDLGLPSKALAQAQWWGFYPSGLVWDRVTGEMHVVGEPHLDWGTLLQTPEPPLPELAVGEFGADDLDYPAGVLAIQELIRAGEVYQVNLSRGVRAQAQGDPLAAYLRLRELNPSPFMAFADLGEEVVVSCSPERLVLWQGNTISARPIAGTRRRGQTPQEDSALEAELRASAKENAEHTMLVDLVRHDLGRVAQPGTVHVPQLMLVERYSHVMHLVSEVAAQAKPDLTLEELLRAVFPGGTITGAPKERVMEAIADLEPHPRHWYTGGLGIVSGAHVDLNILIRTAGFTRTPQGWQVEVRAGGGTVIDSRPEHEAQETVHKAAALLGALASASVAPAAPQLPTGGTPWQPPQAPKVAGLRVLLLDNRDSFTWNLVHDLWALGAEVDVQFQNQRAEDLLHTQPDAVLIGPGPGTPDSSGCTLDLTRLALERGIPLLGVCLGHQALGQVLGGQVVRGQPVHGRPEAMHHNGLGLWEGIAQGAKFGRYHSLVVEGLPEHLVTARSENGVVQALEVPDKPAWAVQFHPESVLSPSGRTLLGNWLRLSDRWRYYAASSR